MKKSLKIILSSLLAFSLIFGTTLTFSDAASTSTTKTIEKLKKQVKSLTASNKKKDAEIKKLKAQVKDRDNNIKNLNSTISSKDEEISKLEAKVKDLEKQTPSVPTTSELGKSRDNAAKINETVVVNNKDWLNGSQQFELTLTEVVSGQSAWTMIKNSNMFNDEPKAGMKYVLAKFKVKVLSLEKEPMEINHSLFDAVSKNGVMYDDFISIVAPTPDFNTKLYKGSEYEGWTYFMVNEDDSPKAVYNEGNDSEVWFDLGL